MRYKYIIPILKQFFFQIFQYIKEYLNVEQLSMIQRKIIRRHLEIKKHIEHFQDIIVHS